MGSFLWFALVISGATPFAYPMPAVAVGAALFALGNSAILVMAIRRIGSSRFVSERREAYRFDVAIPAQINGLECTVMDVSVTGVRVEGRGSAALIPDKSKVDLLIELPTEVMNVSCAVVRRLIEEDGNVDFGLSFLPGQKNIAARLVLYLLHSGARATLPDEEQAAIAA